jgi:hypothetical protein
MARGSPDYKVSNSLYGQTSTDVYELAVRLNSMDVLDRRGSVIFADNFSNLLSPYTLGIGTSSYADIITGTGVSYNNDHVLRIAGRVASSSSIYKWLPIIDTSRYGYECLIGFDQQAGESLTSLEYSIRYYTGSIVYNAQLSIPSATNQLNLLTADAGGSPLSITLLPSNAIKASNTYIIWHYIKLVIDLEALTFTRLIFNTNLWNLASYPLYGIASTNEPSLRVNINNYSAAVPADLYIDHNIVTMNEP